MMIVGGLGWIMVAVLAIYFFLMPRAVLRFFKKEVSISKSYKYFLLTAFSTLIFLLTVFSLPERYIPASAFFSSLLLLLYNCSLIKHFFNYEEKEILDMSVLVTLLSNPLFIIMIMAYFLSCADGRCFIPV